MTTIGNPNISAASALRHAHVDASNPTNASTTMQGGKAVFENDNYRISADDDNTVTINNKHTGETYQAWGDPHMKIDGKDTFDFWGTTTLKLEDGTKVTIETTPWAKDPSMTLSSKVTITNGDYGARVTGIDSNKVGDLKIDETKGWGRVLDAAVSDGNVLQENPSGKGLLAVDKSGQIRAVDQTYINETDLKRVAHRSNQTPCKSYFVCSAACSAWASEDNSCATQRLRIPNALHRPIAAHVSPSPLNRFPAFQALLTALRSTNPSRALNETAALLLAKAMWWWTSSPRNLAMTTKSIIRPMDSNQAPRRHRQPYRTGDLGSFPPGTRIDFGIVNGQNELFVLETTGLVPT